MKYETIGNRPQNEKYPYAVFKVGDRAHKISGLTRLGEIKTYSSVNPCTVVKVERNGSKVTVRFDKFERNEDIKNKWGWYRGHEPRILNLNEIKWDISEHPYGIEVTLTLRCYKGFYCYTERCYKDLYCWTEVGRRPNGRNQLGKGWRAFDDFNYYNQTRVGGESPLPIK